MRNSITGEWATKGKRSEKLFSQSHRLLLVYKISSQRYKSRWKKIPPSTLHPRESKTVSVEWSKFLKRIKNWNRTVTTIFCLVYDAWNCFARNFMSFIALQRWQTASKPVGAAIAIMAMAPVFSCNFPSAAVFSTTVFIFVIAFERKQRRACG